MRYLFLLCTVLVACSSATAEAPNPYGMSCQRVTRPSIRTLYRCENIEAVCYITTEALYCHFKKTDLP